MTAGQARDVLDALPEPPGEAELLRLLGAQARMGHVQAIRALLERIDRDRGRDERPESAIVRLASRGKSP